MTTIWITPLARLEKRVLPIYGIAPGLLNFVKIYGASAIKPVSAPNVPMKDVHEREQHFTARNSIQLRSDKDLSMTLVNEYA